MEVCVAFIQTSIRFGYEITTAGQKVPGDHGLENKHHHKVGQIYFPKGDSL
jgi:hypothetical protein